jgi:hypothetical protein
VAWPLAIIPRLKGNALAKAGAIFLLPVLEKDYIIIYRSLLSIAIIDANTKSRQG